MSLIAGSLSKSQKKAYQDLRLSALEYRKSELEGFLKPFWEKSEIPKIRNVDKFAFFSQPAWLTHPAGPAIDVSTESFWSTWLKAESIIAVPSATSAFEYPSSWTTNLLDFDELGPTFSPSVAYLLPNTVSTAHCVTRATESATDLVNWFSTNYDPDTVAFAQDYATYIEILGKVGTEDRSRISEVVNFLVAYEVIDRFLRNIRRPKDTNSRLAETYLTFSRHILQIAKMPPPVSAAPTKADSETKTRSIYASNKKGDSLNQDNHRRNH